VTELITGKILNGFVYRSYRRPHWRLAARFPVVSINIDVETSSETERGVGMVISEEVCTEIIRGEE